MNSILHKPLTNRPFDREYTIHTSRSSGPGGQHVNKTETKVELRFDIDQSDCLNEEEKRVLKEKLKRRISSDGILFVYAQERRSQLMNKKLAEKRFMQYLTTALKKPKKRIPTKPTKKSVKKRLSKKIQQSEKKIRRGKVNIRQENQS